MVIQAFLAMSFIMLMVIGSIPVTSESTPIISTTIMFSMFQIGLTLVANCISLNAYRTGEVPCWIRVVFLQYIACMLFMDIDTRSTADDHINIPQDVVMNIEHHNKKLEGAKTLGPVTEDITENGHLSKIFHVTKHKKKQQQQVLRKCAQGMATLAEHELAVEQGEIDKEFWVFTSRVVDRMFLVVFLLVFILSSSYIFGRVPDHYTKESFFKT